MENENKERYCKIKQRVLHQRKHVEREWENMGEIHHHQNI
jgi:hypothetical protein